MKIIRFVIVVVISFFWIYLFSSPIKSIPALGPLLSPIQGFWANAPKIQLESYSLSLPDNNQYNIQEVFIDHRGVPFIQADNDEALYYAQGYVHAYMRLWQMDMQTRAAAGRLSEVIGEATLEYDRNQRRKGMVYGAVNSLQLMEQDSITKSILNAYSKGVNDYIKSLKLKDLPLEYKLMGFEPEEWTPLKCSLMAMAMADDLTGSVDDIAMTYLKDAFSEKELNDLFPEHFPNSDPVIPNAISFQKASLKVPPTPKGELFSHFEIEQTNSNLLSLLPALSEENKLGSNNWVVKTEEATILCNDPHLGLSLPSIWFENQLTSKDVLVYGVSLPGTPGVVIGFNDSIAIGVTNNYRDVKDYYEIFTTPNLNSYYFDGKEQQFEKVVETIKIKGKKDFLDTVLYTIHGPVQYDEKFPEPSGSGKMLAVTWMAHRPSNEIRAMYLINRAHNYEQFLEGLSLFKVPAQNFIYSDYQGNIALWGQGQFINKWKGQGKFVMRGDTSSTLWGEEIPVAENPHAFNPTQQNYLASANQTVTNASYPYWYNGRFAEFRSWEINHFLKSGSNTTIEKMMDLQNNTFSYLASKISPLYYFYGKQEDTKYKEYFEEWDAYYSAESKIATAFQIWWTCLFQNIWKDEFAKFPQKMYPSSERTMQILLQDTNSVYIDNILTEKKETLSDLAALSFQQTWDSISKLEKRQGTEWYKVKNTSINHLAKLAPFSYDLLKTGGWGNTINAMMPNHGPSWRMIVKMDKKGVQAFGVYPGGQSGNPGSNYYSNFIQSWERGEYYELIMK